MNRTYECKETIIAFLEGQTVRARERREWNNKCWPFLITKLSDFDDEDLVFQVWGERNEI